MAKRNVFIIHGVEGYPKENWFDWLKFELEELGCNVIVPQFPTPEGQTLENWMKVLEAHNRCPSKDTILVGHSLEVAFLLSALEKRPAHAAFFVAGFSGKLNIPFDEGMKTFAQKEFDWQAIRKNCPCFYVFQSDNDPYVPLKKGQELAENLGAQMTLVKGAGHFNKNAGYTSFPLLLQMIKNEI